MKLPRHVSAWWWVAWVGMFGVLESVAVFDPTPNDTLTQTTLHAVPGLGIVCFLGWLSFHFARRVLDNWHERRKGDGL